MTSNRRRGARGGGRIARINQEKMEKAALGRSVVEIPVRRRRRGRSDPQRDLTRTSQCKREITTPTEAKKLPTSTATTSSFARWSSFRHSCSVFWCCVRIGGNRLAATLQKDGVTS